MHCFHATLPTLSQAAAILELGTCFHKRMSKLFQCTDDAVWESEPKALTSQMQQLDSQALDIKLRQLSYAFRANFQNGGRR